jgi:hypothetical protein
MRQPESLVSVISKIGGLFVAFKLGVFFLIQHIYAFEKKLEKDL